MFRKIIIKIKIKMAISYSYPMGTPKLTDTVLGVQYEEMKDPAVKNFSIGDIVTLVTEEAYTPTLQQVLDQGNTDTAGAFNTLTLTGSTVSILNPISSEGIALRRDSLRFLKNDSFDINYRMDLFPPSAITADRSIEFPDADGTVALTTDIPTTAYKVYTALLFQNGTDAPTATVLENTLGGTINWTRSGVGSYLGTLTGGTFTNQKTVVFTQVPGGAGATWGFQYITKRLSNTEVFFITQIGNSTSTASDDILSGVPIEIRVYN
jgi:hypothetical protein